MLREEWFDTEGVSLRQHEIQSTTGCYFIYLFQRAIIH